MTDPSRLRTALSRPSRHTWMLGGAALVVTLGIGWMLLPSGQSQQQPAGPPSVPVAVVHAESRDVAHDFETVGTIQSLQQVTVRSQIDGILTEILFQEGDLVEKGQLLATIDDRSLKASVSAMEAQVARDEATLRAAELDLARAETLVKRKTAAQQSLDQQRAAVDEARAAVALSKANAEAARVQLSYTRILSPVRGRVGIRQVDAGNLVRMSDADGLVSVTQLDPISVVFPVPQSQFASLKAHVRDAGGTRVTALDRNSGQTLGEGTIKALDNALDTETGTARVRAEFANGDESMTPGAFVSVRISTGRTPGAVTLPAVAVRPGIEGHFVYRVKGDAVQRVNVELGFRNDEVAVVTKGVAPGDVIVSDGYSRLRDGAKVAIERDTPAPGVAQAEPVVAQP